MSRNVKNIIKFIYLIPANTSGVRIVHVGETGGKFRGAWSILDANGNVLHFRDNTTVNKPLEIDDTIQMQLYLYLSYET